MFIKSDIPAIERRLRQADEFLDSPLDTQNMKLMEDVDVMTRLKTWREDTKAWVKDTELLCLETEKPNLH